MEKIIAVVVMIAIVIGLIATAVMPMVSQMNAQGDTALQDLTVLSAGLQDGQVLGATVIQDYQINMSNIVQEIQAGRDDEKAEKIDFGVKAKTDDTAFTFYDQATTNQTLVELKEVVKDKNVYAKEVSYYPSGKIKSLRYTIQAIN